MLDAVQPDLVTVALPNEHHFAPTLQLIRAGVPLLVEKPLVFDLAEADQLLREAAERDLFLAINFNHRYAEPMLRAQAAITAGALGDIVFTSWRFGGEANIGTHPHAQLIETQCHAFDTIEHLCGPIVVRDGADGAAPTTARTRPSPSRSSSRTAASAASSAPTTRRTPTP